MNATRKRKSFKLQSNANRSKKTGDVNQIILVCLVHIHSALGNTITEARIDGWLLRIRQSGQSREMEGNKEQKWTRKNCRVFVWIFHCIVPMFSPWLFQNGMRLTQTRKQRAWPFRNETTPDKKSNQKWKNVRAN